MIISTDELSQFLNHDDLVLIDARSFKEYSQSHIPGAVNLDLFSFHWVDTSNQGLENFDSQMIKIFSMAGIDNTKKVIFYDDASGMLAARGVWLLMYFSHPDVSMLDGGLKKWNFENKATETQANGFKPSLFEAKIDPSFLVGFEYILDNLDRLTIIDARSKDEFEGKLIRAAQSGHIPNSINIDWSLNLTEQGTFKNDSELSDLYSLPKDAEIITYCQGAYRAANSFLALKKLGFENVRVYLGSWGEWGNKPELPIN